MTALRTLFWFIAGKVCVWLYCFGENAKIWYDRHSLIAALKFDKDEVRKESES